MKSTILSSEMDNHTAIPIASYCVDINITLPDGSSITELPPSLTQSILFDVCKALFSVEAVGWVSWKQNRGVIK